MDSEAGTDPEALLAAADEAVEAAHVPYSGYAVGAALRAGDGSVHTGCNVEVANYSNTLHAEEVALGSAVRAGHTDLEAVGVVSAADDGVTPCGMCRQSLVEFCGPDTPVHCRVDGEPRTHRLGTLLPEPIDEATLS